ncbi:hypothetical protein KAR10_01930, partial [bacterium]|nr:hypothetical protein [bacterium]
QIVIDPFKQILRQMKNPSAKAGEILNAELTRVLNPKAAETADIMLRSRSEQLPTDINRYYAQQTFRGSIREAKTAWKNVVYSSIRSPKAWFSQNILYSGRQLISLYRADLYVSRGKTAEVQKGAILAETRNLLELYQLGENMMKRVLSREAGGAEINAMRNQVSKIAEAVKDSELAITKTEQKTLGDTWKASHKQFKNLPKLNNGMSWTVAMVAQRLNLQKTDGTPDLDTARLIMAPNYGQAVRMIQGDLLLFNKYIDQEMSPGLSEAQKIEVQEIGVRRIGTFLRTLPLVHGFLQSWDTRAMNKAQYRQLPQAIAGLEALIHQKQAATEPVTAAAAAAGVAAAAAVAAQAAEQEVITYQGRSMTLEQAQNYLAHMQAGQEDLQGRYGIIDGQNKYVGMFSKLWQGYSLRSITSWNPSALRSRVGSEMRAHWIPLTGLIAATAILLVSGVGTASGAVALSFVMGGVIPAQQVERLLPRTKTTAATVEPVGIRFEESEQPLSSGQQSVMQAWKAEVGQSRDGIMAYEALAHILSSLGVEINVAEKAKTYGYMHMLAALFDLVPAFEVSPDSRVVPDIWQEMKAQGIKAQQEGLATLYIATQAEGADQEAGVLNVDQSTLAFFEQRFAEVLLNGAVQAAERVMFTGKERELLDLWLMENSAFKNDACPVTEFIKQYIMSGEDLRNLVQVNTGLQPVHALVAKKFGGYEFKEGDLIELNQAILEIESGAYLLMAVKAEGIESASSRIRQVRAAEFEQTFGISYTAYKEMITPPMVQRIMQYVFSAKDFGRNNQPTVNVKTAGRQMLGIGTVAVIIGGVVLGTVSGALPVALGLAALGAGAVLVMEGALVWIRSGKIAFDLNPSDAVAEQLWAADFASADPEMAQAAGVIQDLMQAGKKAEAGQKRESFTKQFGMSYQTYQKITLPALLRNPGFVKAVANLGIKGTRQVVSETMQNRAIRFALEHLVAVVDSDISKEAKIQLTEDVVQVLGILQFQVNMKYDKHADALKVQLTPETIPRTLTKDNKIGRLFKNLEGMGISIKLQFAPIKKPIKLKSTGSAA